MSKQGNKLTPLAPISSLRTPRAVPNSPVSSRNPEARALQCWEPWWAEPLPSDPCQPHSAHGSSPAHNTPGAGGAASPEGHSTDRAQEGTCTTDPPLLRAPNPLGTGLGHEEPLRNLGGKYPQTVTAPPAL